MLRPTVPQWNLRRFIHVLFAALFSLYICIGLRVYGDYGVPLDEYAQIDIGRINYERIAMGNMEIQSFYDRYYGPAFEVPLYMWSALSERYFGIGEIESRHLGIFLFFAASLPVFYRLLTLQFGSPAYGLLGVILLVLWPRFFAESFYNTKDMAFVAVTIGVLYALHMTIRMSGKAILFLAITSGLAIGVRAQGLLLVLVCTLILLWSNRDKPWVAARFVFLYLVLTGAAASAVFPVFWNDFFRNIAGFWNASANPVGVPTYFFGRSFISPDLPRYYHFVWIGITGMLSVLGLASVGIAMFFFRRQRVEQDGLIRGVSAMILIIVSTLLTSVFFHPRSYDGWRHIYYLYPCFIGCALYGIRYVAEQRRNVFRVLLAGTGMVMLLDVLGAVRFMIVNHPHEYVYFNGLAGGYRHAQANFDFDYWGMSYTDILSYLGAMPAGTGYRIYFEQPLPFVDIVMIPKLQKLGMTVVASAAHADLYISIHRDIKEPPPPAFRKIYAVTVEGADLSAVYKRL